MIQLMYSSISVRESTGRYIFKSDGNVIAKRRN